MQTILVTGGCGYIGAHTIVDLIENGFNVKNNYGVSEKKFMNGYFESSGPFIFHNVEGYDDSSIEFTLLPNEERNTGMFTQTEVKIGGKKFYLTGVKNY